MKFLALLLLAVSATYAVALPAGEAEAEPDNTLVARKTCTRRLKFRPDKHGVCLDLAVRFAACTGGRLYKADCGILGATWSCCILSVGEYVFGADAFLLLHGESQLMCFTSDLAVFRLEPGTFKGLRIV